MTKKKSHSKRQRQNNAEPNEPITRALMLAIDAQENMAKVAELQRKWQQHRRDQVRAAFAAGADTREISAALGISRAKIYRLIGSARAIQA